MSRVLILLCLLIQPLYGEIIEIDSFDQIKEHLNSLGNQDLVLFDVDYTLTIPDDAVLRPAGQELLSKLKKEILEAVLEGTYPNGFLHSQVVAKTTSTLVEKSVFPLISDLQKRGVPTLAFTGAIGGKLGIIESMADWRITELKIQGLDFSQAFPVLETIEFPKKEGKEFPPLFKDGVLFASKRPKGEVLPLFLEKVQWRPKKVVFFDDRIKYLRSVEKSLKKMSIEFLGYHYVAAWNETLGADEALARFQFEYLVKHGKWLNDKAAQEKLKNIVDKI